MIAGIDIEYYVHEYEPQKSTATTPATNENRADGAKKYTFRLLKRSILPTCPNTFSHISLSLESLNYYKRMMVESIVTASDVEKSYSYSSNYNEFEPTVTLLKLDG